MLGSRRGSLRGSLIGSVKGSSVDDEGPSGGIAGVSRDSTSLIYVPNDSSEWTTFIASAGAGTVPNSLWRCQEASGNLADTIGSVTLTANATPLYQQAVTGWTRLGVGLNGGAAQRFMAAAGVGPNPATTSQTWLFFINVTAAPASIRTHISISGGATNAVVQVTTTPVYRAQVAGINVAGTGNPSATGIMPVVFKYDRTNSLANVYTTQEKITGTYNAGVVDGIKGIGGGAGSSVNGQCVYGCMWSGANAEMTDATLRTLLTAMGWTIPW